jgi:hypothetical protein
MGEWELGIMYHESMFLFFYQNIGNDNKKSFKYMLTVTGKITFDKILQEKLQVNMTLMVTNNGRRLTLDYKERSQPLTSYFFCPSHHILMSFDFPFVRLFGVR